MGRNWAIAVGINSYNNLQPLKYAKRDAEAMRDFFAQLPCESVFLFTEDAASIPVGNGPPIPTQPTLGNLRYFLRFASEQLRLQAGDNLWFFFSGHGLRSGERDYLMPCDGDPGDVEATGIPVSLVTERLRKCGADNVILLLDACRNGGRKAGVGIGAELQPGVVSLFSCSPNEVSYEVDALQQGAFTHALLQGLKIQGEGNCATVERLNDYLRRQVPQLVQSTVSSRCQQTPYGHVEPLSKCHLILLPRQATLADVATLKRDALKAEVSKDWQLAEELWIRVLAVSPADMDAVEGIRRLVRSPSEEAEQRPSVLPHSGSSRSGEASSQQRKSVQTSSRVSQASTIPGVSRRRVIQVLGFGGAGIGVAVLGKGLLSPQTKVANSPAAIQNSLKLEKFSFPVVSLNEKGSITNRRQLKSEQFIEDLGSGIKLAMVSIPGGKFLMGSPETEEGRENNESPQHEVTVPAFCMGKYPITQAQWKAITNLPKVEIDLQPDPSHFKGSDRPVERVSWLQAIEFCKRLSKKTGKTYRLPSEAEWEYACRAGTTTPFYVGRTITTELANYDGDFTYGKAPKGVDRQQTTAVEQFPANQFGLFDLQGNVWEWCLDHWYNNYEGAPTDGSAWFSEGENSFRVLRGGSWYDRPRHCRSACRYINYPVVANYNIGFRVVCVVPRTME